MSNLKYYFTILLLLPFVVTAQEDSTDVEEVVVVGSQIKELQ